MSELLHTCLRSNATHHQAGEPRRHHAGRGPARLMSSEESAHGASISFLVLACGNTLRGDDGVGWRIGSLLIENPPCDSLQVILTRQLLPEHAEPLSKADTA